MGRYKNSRFTTEVEIYNNELIDHLEDCGYTVTYTGDKEDEMVYAEPDPELKQAIQTIFEKYRKGLSFNNELEQLFKDVLHRVI